MDHSRMAKDHLKWSWTMTCNGQGMYQDHHGPCHDGQGTLNTGLVHNPEWTRNGTKITMDYGTMVKGHWIQAWSIVLNGPGIIPRSPWTMGQWSRDIEYGHGPSSKEDQGWLPWTMTCNTMGCPKITINHGMMLKGPWTYLMLLNCLQNSWTWLVNL